MAEGLHIKISILIDKQAIRKPHDYAGELKSRLSEFGNLTHIL